MGQRHEKKLKSSKSPPVGSYNLRKEKDFIVPSHSFGKEKRDNLNINKTALENPGPRRIFIPIRKNMFIKP